MSQQFGQQPQHSQEQHGSEYGQMGMQPQSGQMRSREMQPTSGGTAGQQPMGGQGMQSGGQQMGPQRMSGQQSGGQQMGGQSMQPQQARSFEDHLTNELRIALEDFTELSHIATWCAKECSSAGPQLGTCAQICQDIAELAELNKKLIARDSMFGPEVADTFIRVATEGLPELRQYQQQHPHVAETITAIERTMDSCETVLGMVGQQMGGQQMTGQQMGGQQMTGQQTGGQQMTGQQGGMQGSPGASAGTGQTF
ncbi:hypothetical protein [Halopiger djelfimassiliensis]|uniref:hypothetical protein n=1 Tax=Halopiger djelfimassiliensis TaxID=1293047 RepID=UPI002DD9A1CB|nr:hypothetical protein [Halopiger djelfimassiliensis]